MSNISRRLVLKGMGFQLVLPLLNNFAPLSALAQSNTARKNFVGVYFPNGTHIPPGEMVGPWHWNDPSGVLNGLKTGSDAVAQNVMIIRNLFNGDPGIDPHWQNCSGFLSAKLINLDLLNIKCGKTIDQMIADTKSTFIRSIEVGGPYFHKHPLVDHPNYSDLYLNRISWKTDEQALTPQTDPYALFNFLFSTNQSGARNLAYLRENKRSVLDTVLGDLQSIKAKTSAEGKLALDQYGTSLREIETNLNSASPVCMAPLRPTLSYANKNVNYVDRVTQFQRMMVFAMKCGLTNVGTIMYTAAVSEEMTYAGDIGNGIGHHDAAHHQGIQRDLIRLQTINKMHVGLLKNLLNQLRENGLLNETLVMYGTDMSDGDTHHTENIPTLLCGGGADLKFGQDITLPSRTSYASLLLSILSNYGIQAPSLGSGVMQSSTNINAFIKV
jgi:hypothetical protein